MGLMSTGGGGRPPRESSEMSACLVGRSSPSCHQTEPLSRSVPDTDPLILDSPPLRPRLRASSVVVPSPESILPFVLAVSVVQDPAPQPSAEFEQPAGNEPTDEKPLDSVDLAEPDPAEPDPAEPDPEPDGTPNPLQTPPGEPEPAASPTPTPAAEAQPPTCKRADFQSFDDYVACRDGASRESSIELRMQEAADRNDWAEYYRLKGELSPSPHESAPIVGSRSSERGQVRDWVERERRLVGATAGFGIAYGVTTIAWGVMYAVAVNEAVECAESDVLADMGSTCAGASKKLGRLGAPIVLTAVASGGLAVGTIVSAILLGVHRSRRPHRFGLRPAVGGIALEF